MSSGPELDESGLRAAERRLQQALGASDPTAWVYEYRGQRRPGDRLVRGQLGQRLRRCRARGPDARDPVLRREADGRWRVAMEHVG